MTELVAINSAIFNPALVTPLRDANGDGLCNVADIVAVNRLLHSDCRYDVFAPARSSLSTSAPTGLTR